MSSINSLLNHEPSMGQEPHAAQDYVAPSTFDAADALTTLATLGSGQQYAPMRELPSPTASVHPPRRPSSIGSHAAPVEPLPPVDPQPQSPTLEHYHHGSKSPEEQRRQSLLPRSSPAPVLAPIQNMSNNTEDQILEQPATHVTDMSQLVPSPSHAAVGSVRDDTQNREPALIQDEPTTSQTIAPEFAESTAPHPVSTDLSGLQMIKNESTGTPREATPSAAPAPTTERHRSITGENVDADTLKAIEIARQSDLGLRAKRNASIAESVTSPTEPKPIPSKKRPAPSSASAIKKKGTATAKKPTSKKRKLDPEGDVKARSTTPTSRPAKTASSKAGKKGSQAGTPVAGSSPAPDHSSQIHPSDDEAESSDDNTLYCICRKPDNHRWMIGCDGGCEDWFHGSCVNMNQADEDLVDKFICPNCEENGRGQTTWKAMCRRVECRKPARLTKGSQSKYCSDECGVVFMQEQLQRTAGAQSANASKKRAKKGGKNGEEHASDDEPTPLGGVLRAKDLKALVDQSRDIQAFRSLGSGVLSPPQTASPTKATFDGTLPNGTRRLSDDLALTPGETERLTALFNEKSQLKDRLEVLKDREKFVSMVKEQATRVAEREKIKAKEFCGYDSRLSWSDAEFLHWRGCKHGRAAFKFSTLSPSVEQLNSLDSTNGEDTTMVNGEEDKETVCLRKRCQKHPAWQKLNLQDARFEELEIVESIKECEKEERSVRERARRRGAKDAMAKELTSGESGIEERNRDGWVQAVGL
jgi:COMPASS component SPP1